MFCLSSDCKDLSFQAKVTITTHHGDCPVTNSKFACFRSLSLRITFGHPNPILSSFFFFSHKKTIDAVTRIIGFYLIT